MKAVPNPWGSGRAGGCRKFKFQIPKFKENSKSNLQARRIPVPCGKRIGPPSSRPSPPRRRGTIRPPQLLGAVSVVFLPVVHGEENGSTASDDYNGFIGGPPRGSGAGALFLPVPIRPNRTMRSQGLRSSQSPAKTLTWHNIPANTGAPSQENQGESIPGWTKASTIPSRRM